MPKICPSCGNESPEQFRFCGFCGASLEAAPSQPPPAEPTAESRSSRRLATVLFADLTNFTRAAERADPEEVFLTVRRTLERLARPVLRMGGRIDRYVGDGFLATFGVPEAHENDPERALLAALEMQASMVDLRVEASQSLSWDAQLRVGVHVGQVISGHIEGGPLPDSSVYGHAVNIANRLQGAARPGTVLVSEATYLRTRAHFSFLEPVRLQLRGMDKSIVGYECAGRRPDPQPTRGLSGRATPLVGRGAECDALIAGLQRLEVERRGMIALVTGEAGVGKSRLVEEVLAPLAERFTVIRTESSPNEVLSYGLLANLLEALAGISPDDPAPTRQQRLDEWLSVSGSLAREVRPVLHDLIGATARAGPAVVDAQQQQRLIFAAARRVMAWMARRRPLVLFLDDLHWADPSSLEVLAHVADLVHEAPLTIIAVARSVARASLPPSFLRADPDHPDAFLEIGLQTLSAVETDHLLTLLLSEVTLPPTLKHAVVERTGGNPLLLEEMVRMLLDQGVIQETPDGWQIGSEWAETVQKVPDNVNGLILHRYDRLAPALKGVVDMAAVLGRSFALPLLAAVTKMPEPQLRHHLASLEQADFIRRTAGAGVPLYFFRHALVQEAVYHTILQTERRVLHLQAAQAVQQMAEGLALDSAALVGYHLERALSPQAVTYLMQAAQRAAERYANPEALDYYRRAEALLAPAEGRQDQVVDIALGLSELLYRTGEPEAAREQLERARIQSLGMSASGYRLGDVMYRLGFISRMQGAHNAAFVAFEAAGTILRDNAAQCQSFGASDIEREMGWVLFDQGKLSEARTWAEKALALASEQSNPRAAGSAHNLLAGIHFFAGQLPEAVASARQALAVREQAGDIWGAASTQANLGALYYRLGQWAKAESFLRQAIFVQQEIGDHHSLGISWNALGLLLLDSGRFDEALHCLDQAIAALHEQQGPTVLATALFYNRGLVGLRLGDAARAVPDITKGLDLANQLNNDYHRAVALSYLAEARLASGELPRALELMQQAAAASDASGSPETRAEVLRVQSYILKRENNPKRALEANHQARDLYRQMGNRYEVARRQLEAIEIQLAPSGSAEETELAAGLQAEALDALRTFRELRAQADLARAESLLAKISSRLAPAGAPIGRGAQWATVVVDIRLLVPEVLDDRPGQQEIAAAALNNLTAHLGKIGRAHGALVTADGSNLTYLFAGAEPAEAAALALTAIQSALAAIETGVRLNAASRRQYYIEIPLSIGIAAGSWQALISRPEEAAVFVNVSQIGRRAKAVAALSSPNQILLAGEVARSAEAVYELDPVVFDGDRRLVEPVFRLSRAKSDVHFAQALPGSSAQLIGRGAELASLKGWVDRVRSEPRGLLCYLEAEAGMGKSRLVEEVLTFARPDLLCLVGKCESFRSGISYWAFIDMLEHARLPETPGSRRLKSLLGLRPPDEADDDLLRSLPPANLRQELFGRVREFLLHEASHRPVLVTIEDIHWLDLSSLDLLDFLLPLALEARIAILLVARAEMPGPHRALVSKAERVGRERYLPIAFSSLSEAESLALIRELNGTPAMPDDLWEMVRPFSGHPLSIEEALRYLVERGWLCRSDGHVYLADFDRSRGYRMPGTFKDLLLGRLDMLGNETLHVLQAAAVLGETLDRAVLSRIVPEPSLARQLTELVDRGWLLPPTSDEPSLYRFKHTLTRETIYATLLASKKQVLHQRAGEAIESLYPEAQEEYLELLAHHFGHSTIREKALHYQVRAAEKSLARHALAEALDYFDKARDLLQPGLPSQARLSTRVALGLADVHLALGRPASAVADISPLLETGHFEFSADLRAGCLRRLATARRKMGEFTAALENLRAALDALAAWKASHSQAPAAVLEGVDRELLVIELGLAQTQFDMHDNARAREQAEYVLGLVDERRHPELAAEALNLMGGLAYRHGENQSATRLVERSLAIYQLAGNRSGAGAAYANLGVLAANRHDLEAARDNFHLSLAIREALGDAQGIAITRNNLGQLEMRSGHRLEAIRDLKIAADTARRSDLTQLLAQGLANLGRALTVAGRYPEALSALAEAEPLCQSYDFKDLLCEVLWKRADCLVASGNPAAAESVATTALALAATLESEDLGSEARRALASACRKQGKIAAALEDSAAAWQVRQDDPDPVVRARFAAEHARALKAAGQADEAHRLWAEHVQPVKRYDGVAAAEEIARELIGDGDPV